MIRFKLYHEKKYSKNCKNIFWIILLNHGTDRWIMISINLGKFLSSLLICTISNYFTIIAAIYLIKEIYYLNINDNFSNEKVS